jgi:signal peptidase II
LGAAPACGYKVDVSRRSFFFIALTAAIVLFDQWTKYLAVGHLTAHFDGHDGAAAELRALYSDPPPASSGYHYLPRGEVEIARNVLRLRHAENPGAAWGLFRDLPPGLRGLVFHVVSIGAVVMIIAYFRRLSGRPEERWALVGLPLVLGGAIGNYIDRLARSFVIDFIEAHWFDRAHWPSFNVADVAITVGVICLLIDGLVRRERKDAPVPARS